MTYQDAYDIMYTVGFFRWEGGEYMRYIVSFVVAVVAKIVGYCFCKWLDSHKSDK